MSSIVKTSIFVLLISCCSFGIFAQNSTASTHFTGLLSDILLTNQQNNLDITSLCNKELVFIQNGLDLRDVWAIKCKCSDDLKKYISNWIVHFSDDNSKMDFTYDLSFNLRILSDQTMIILKTTIHKVRISFSSKFWIIESKRNSSKFTVTCLNVFIKYSMCIRPKAKEFICSKALNRYTNPYLTCEFIYMSMLKKVRRIIAQPKLCRKIFLNVISCDLITHFTYGTQQTNIC